MRIGQNSFYMPTMKRIVIFHLLNFLCCDALEQNSRYNNEQHVLEILVRLEYRLKRLENKLQNGIKDARDKTCTDCPDSWIRFNQSCYLFEERKFSFFNARYHCQHLGGDLVHINNFAENEFLRKHLKTLKGVKFWIGLEDIVKEGDFRWVDDRMFPSFTGWDSGQPNNYGGGEDCTHFHSGYNYNWNDMPCKNEVGSICEKQAKL